MNPKVDTYLADGCGRFPLYKTADCKVITWQAELIRIRSIVLDCGIQEEIKWSQPCYTHNSKNILIVAAFKAYAFISFFKGSLLKDESKILDIPGKSSQAVRQIRFTSTEQIDDMEPIIRAYIHEAIEIEDKGLKVQFQKNMEPEPDELIAIFLQDSEFEKAFRALTPGRQRGYILHFSQAKQSKTRSSRIEKYKPKILSGLGFHD